jgi:hypothetical protein
MKRNSKEFDPKQHSCSRSGEGNVVEEIATWPHGHSVHSDDVSCSHTARMLTRAFQRSVEELTGMNMPIATSVAVTFQKSPAWVKSAARAAFLLLLLKGSLWVGASWLTFRGFAVL